MVKHSKPTVISTFAGCGGSSLGYKMAGFEELLAVEWDDDAVATFRMNFLDVPIFHGDIGKLTSDECLHLAGIEPGQLDIFDGSPPCQGFSTAGKRQFSDPRNSLFKEYVRLLNDLQPKVFVMENVTGMIKGVMAQAYLTIVKSLRDCGYRVKGEVLNAMYFDVPQARQRVIIIGVRNDLEIEPSHPRPLAKPISVRKALNLETAGGVQRGWGMRGDGIRNEQFQNQYRDLSLPCVTLEKSRPPIIRLGDIERELTLAECAKIASFPESFKWGKKAYERIGNSVPPNLMKAIAWHIRSEILDKAKAAT